MTPSSASTPQASDPPWQVRWKRPQWDRVVVGMDNADDSSADSENSDSCDDVAGDCDGVGARAANGDTSAVIDESWIPVSCSSVALTRKEARTAILELHRRGKLLHIHRRRRRRRRKRKKNTTTHESKIHETRGHENVALSQKEEEKPTPRNRNTKSAKSRTLQMQSSVPFNNTPETRINKDVGESSTADNITTNAPQSPPPPPESSLSSPSNWFRSITSPGRYRKQSKATPKIASGKPPLSISRPLPINNAIKSPSSPTIFSTFNLTTPPPPAACDGDNDDDDDCSSPPNMVMDASTASSLLWEDMTLTSVSEEDAAVIRLFGNQRQINASKTTMNPPDGGGGEEVGLSKNSGESTGSRLFNLKNDLGGGRYYYDRHGHVRLSDWDGFDNVVLSVTIFATSGGSASRSKNGASLSGATSPKHLTRPTSGEVVVMELLSTKSPPSSNDPALNKRPAAAASKSERESSRTQQNKMSPSSPNSSLSNPSSSSAVPPVPPPQSLPSPSTHEGGSTSTSGEDDSTSNSTKINAKEQTNKQSPELQQPNLLSNIIGDDGKTEASNHTRILARRVLWWPSCILSQRSKNGDPQIISGDDNCPSFVSLGRTSVWKERKSCDNEELAGEDFDQMGERNLDDEDHQGQMPGNGNDIETENYNQNHNDAQGNCASYSRADRVERVADAMDAVRSLNFLFGGGPLPPSSTKKKPAPAKISSDKPTIRAEGKKSININSLIDGSNNDNLFQGRKKLTQPLSMCLVTGAGHIHFFYAMRVLLSGVPNNKAATSNKSLGISNSFAALLLGEELYTRINENVMPLSCPRATMRLSSQLVAPSYTVKNGSRKKEQEHLDYGFHHKQNCIDPPKERSLDPPTWEKFLRHENTGSNDEKLQSPATENEANDASQGNNWTSLSAFDASIDPSSLPLRTLRRSNVLTGTCVTSDTSNSYLAICGKGLRSIVRKDSRQRGHALGGFVSFVSLRHCAEARTIYLPFAPESIQPIYWCGMHFVVLMGEGLLTKKTHLEAEKCKNHRCCRRPYAIAVRVDCKQGDNWFSSGLPLDIDGDWNIVEPENLDSVFMSATPAILLPSSKKPATHEAGNNTAYPSRFQTVAINLPPVEESMGSLSRLFNGECPDSIQSNAIAISSIPSSPPGIILSFQCHSTLVVVNHTFLPLQNVDNGVYKSWSLSTLVRPGHRVLLDDGLESCSTQSSVTAPEQPSPISRVWCTGGQGWSLVGIQWTGQTYFICWDGATDDSQGPFIFPLQHVMKNTSFCFATEVMPLMSHIKYSEKLDENCHRAVAKLPSVPKPYYSLPSFLRQDEIEGAFLSPKRSLSATLKESIKIVADMEGGLDDILVEALNNISTPRYQSPESRSKSTSGVRTPKMGMTHQEISKRLLRQCSSWTQLDDTKANRGIVHGQVIAATIRLGAQFQSLTLRTNTIANPVSTPFNQILSWLCQRRDYFTAASIALSLLDDADAVYELCGIPKSVERWRTLKSALLDGIKPLRDESVSGDVSGTLTSLADMAVGCLIKGGTSMSKTLEGFLIRNTLYNAPRACLMLVGATSSAVSIEPASKLKLNKADNIMDMLSNVDSPNDDLIWPVRCLLKMAVVRNCLPSTILMLNATIPNELRWRAPKSRGLAIFPRPSLGLFLALVETILESTEKATRLFLNMMDEESGPNPYWFSVDYDTKLALCQVSIRGKHVMLQEPEVRAWALDRLKEEIESPSKLSCNMDDSLLPDDWLKEVVNGVFYNAECDIGLGLDTMLMTDSASKGSQGEVLCYRQDMLCVRQLLVQQKPSFGLDFDLVIASLLILVCRGCDWREGTQISAQTILNTVCDMAGRKTNAEPRFIFDGATVMRQCALADNLQAAAFLVGGKKGLVLECADLVVSNLSMTMKDAEIALVIGSLGDLKDAVASTYEALTEQKENVFAPTASHNHLMWLIEEHVLNVHTYGEFDSLGHTGEINPVHAGRVCFRAWYCVTHPSDLPSSAQWLERWMRGKLGLSNGKSPRRLACAALVRALLWADETEELDLSDVDDEPLLGAVMNFDRRFLAELAQSCCGLIQSIPPHLAEELMSSLGGSNMFPLETPLLNSAQYDCESCMQ